MNVQTMLQDAFFADLIDQRMPVAVYLTNGIRLVGTMQSFDSFTVLLSNNGVDDLIYKRAIASVVPNDSRPKVGPASFRRGEAAHDRRR